MNQKEIKEKIESIEDFDAIPDEEFDKLLHSAESLLLKGDYIDLVIMNFIVNQGK